MNKALEIVAPTEVTITKLVIETKSPMAIYTGRRATGFDNELARDVKGLPMIPASAIAGVWRHLVENAFPAENTKAKTTKPSLAERWFGHITSGQEQAACTFISHGQLLDSYNQKIANYADIATLAQKDEVIALARQSRPHHRERVSINDRGVAKETGKFDQLLLPAGMRFAITLEWNNCPRADGYQLTEKEWLCLLNLWQSPYFAFGSNTRNGLGRIAIIYSDMQCFQLTRPEIAEDIKRYRQSPVNQTHALKTKLCSQESMIKRQYKITLEARDNWRCGSGSELLGNHDTEQNINIISYSEPRICWQSLPAKIQAKQAVLCGSSIKGMLAHRLAFHYRKLTQQWAESMENASHDEWQQRPQALKNLLGFADDKDHFNSLSGALWVEDSLLEYKHTTIRTHNSIDRFTGGVRKGALYSEELLFQPRMTITLNVSRDLTQTDEDRLLLQALENTINDLEKNLLPFGAGSGRGTSLMKFIKKDVIVNQESNKEDVA